MALQQISDSTASSPARRGTHFKCFACPDQFKREDHLRRHELSHGFPHFLCPHPGCGMRFHRSDVLKRHKTVHQASPSKRRRRPRRGSLPRGKIQSLSKISSPPVTTEEETHVFTTPVEASLHSSDDPGAQHPSPSAKPEWQFHNREDSHASECSSDSGISLIDRDFDLQVSIVGCHSKPSV